ncbi:MAG TPA: FAD-dependent oxidoreductase [Gemmatimonadales bacterium]
MPRPRRIAIIGAGFTGSLLARILTGQGYEVLLFERGRHPRFAIGESTTPLANLALERLARRYGLPDLYALAAHGRWLRAFPEVRRGLKRGFTFYQQRRHARYANTPDNGARLLVAASPGDEVADSHWLRADVDHFLVREAVAAGVDYRDSTSLEDISFGASGPRIRGSTGGKPFTEAVDFVVDASGPARFLARHLAIPSALGKLRTRSALLFSHFRGVREFQRVAAEEGAAMPPGPYLDHQAAVHHLLREGWMYLLAFDHGVTSAGFLLAPDGMAGIAPRWAATHPEAAWQRLLGRYPSIERQFEEAEPLFPIGFRPMIQHRMSRAVGTRWAVLPHTYAFVDPLFSTGIAWGLLGVERLALAFESAATESRVPWRAILDRYGRLLSAEADQIDRLVYGGYLSRGDFGLFTAHALLYFATVSFTEVSQRIGVAPDPAWRGFLGAGDAEWEAVFAESVRRIKRAVGGSHGAVPARIRSAFAEWVREAIATRNIGGLFDSERRNMYPVDLELLVDRCHLLGLDRPAMLAALPLLRGAPHDIPPARTP